MPTELSGIGVTSLGVSQSLFICGVILVLEVPTNPKPKRRRQCKLNVVKCVYVGLKSRKVTLERFEE